ncbi:HAD family hydrolase, partial [Streptomyces sp. SID89]|nr:HAD family hydrolase [Streptomyces sp. SID89]
ARERRLRLPEALDFTSTPGRGVSATIEGRTVEVGSPARLPAATGPASAAVAELEEAGRTAVLVLRDGIAVGVIGLADRLRPDAAATVAALTDLTGHTP